MNEFTQAQAELLTETANLLGAKCLLSANNIQVCIVFDDGKKLIGTMHSAMMHLSAIYPNYDGDTITPDGGRLTIKMALVNKSAMQLFKSIDKRILTAYTTYYKDALDIIAEKKTLHNTRDSLNGQIIEITGGELQCNCNAIPDRWSAIKGRNISVQVKSSGLSLTLDGLSLDQLKHIVHLAKSI